MNRSIRRVAYALVALIGFMAAWLTWVSTDAGARYRDDPRNPRSRESAADDARGRLLSADGVVLALDGEGWREYPQGASYAHVVGWDSPFGLYGLESTRFADLRSRDESITSWMLGIGSDRTGPDDLVLTIRDEMQRAALDGLSGRTGAVVAIDAATGAVLAYASTPSLDPNRVTAGDVDPADHEDAATDRAAHRVLPPGSTFKVIVSAAALRSGFAPDDLFDDAVEYTAPGAGAAIGNAGGGDCAAGDSITLTDALVVSCNTVFARLAVELGGDSVASAAERTGFNAPIGWELGLVRSSIPSGSELSDDPGALAQTGIGERDVRATPLHLALVAAAIGNDGVAMAPYAVSHRLSPSGRSYERTRPRAVAEMFSAEEAALLLQMMEEVVARGTGTAAAVEGIVVAGKTGTAEGSGGPHAWFIGVGSDADARLGIAVVVEGGGSGGLVAAPIAARVLSSWLGSNS